MSVTNLITDAKMWKLGITKPLAKAAAARGDVIKAQLSMGRAPRELRNAEFVDLAAMAAAGTVRAHAGPASPRSPRRRPRSPQFVAPDVAPHVARGRLMRASQRPGRPRGRQAPRRTTRTGWPCFFVAPRS